MRTSIEDRHRGHEELSRMTDRLIAEFHGVFTPGTVMSTVARNRERLLSSGVTHGLVPAVEAAVRAQLSHFVPAHAPVS